jgi:N,N'-diacetylchitobiose transport system permease protein
MSAVALPDAASGLPRPRSESLEARSGRSLLHRVFPYLLIAPACLVLAGVLGYPLVDMLAVSLQRYGLSQLIAHRGVFVGLRNYTDLARDPQFWGVVVRSLVFTAVVVATTVVLSTLIALLLERMSRPMRILLTAGLVLIWATPVIVAVDLWQWMFDYEFGVVNWLLTFLHLGNFVHHNWYAQPLQGFVVIAIVVVWGALPFAAITLFAGLTQVPAELVESAEVDGATGFQVFRAITVPILKPIFLIVTSLSIIWDFEVFIQPYVLLNARPSGGYFTMAVFMYVESFRVSQYGLGSAIAVVTVAVLLAASFYYVRQMVRVTQAPA